MSGRLKAKLDGPHAKFTFEPPEGYDHSFMVERFHGMKQKKDALGMPVVDASGVPVMEEDWRPIHSGTRKFVEGTTTHHMRWPEPDPSDPHARAVPPGPHRYRALAYRLAEESVSGVKILHTEGVYTPEVRV